MKMPKCYKRGFGALLLGLMVIGMAGCGDEPPDPDAAPEPEEPMGSGPMSTDEAGETPSEGV